MPQGERRGEGEGPLYDHLSNVFESRRLEKGGRIQGKKERNKQRQSNQPSPHLTLVRPFTAGGKKKKRGGGGPPCPGSAKAVNDRETKSWGKTAASRRPRERKKGKGKETARIRNLTILREKKEKKKKGGGGERGLAGLARLAAEKKGGKGGNGTPC